MKNGDVEDISDTELRLGLLAYPVLQAADILLYKRVVPLLYVPDSSVLQVDGSTCRRRPISTPRAIP